ncbi:peroxiredoxin [Streptomyces sp. SL13]|jgi:peroxiredoxin Q/BCP|uniref:thioredoxin-dependent peroxiredoxin n=1 Tax=Streptantibioticus silvisoli TaxID=2705255 RepID=A0AA90K206_9ACTN|nr:peroxiredoxin [Streptantibioticus silvisoli]MDI5967106.1 peroxiredoxin [Streptantibioticus silvisoli]MDI5974261.1 peroxiredoxin [Streptantibioticus silvisoli]
MAGTPEIGDKVADFALPGGVADGEGFSRREYRLSQAAGHPVVLAFYPGDDTSVCTKQMCSYSTGLERFAGLDAEVWGISPQDVDSHESFARKYDLRMPLLADTGREVARAFGIAVPGLGLRRAVFLVGPDGVLRWKHVALLGATFQSVDTLTQQLSALSAG